ERIVLPGGKRFIPQDGCVVVQHCRQRRAGDLRDFGDELLDVLLHSFLVAWASRPSAPEKRSGETPKPRFIYSFACSASAVRCNLASASLVGARCSSHAHARSICS